MSYQPTPATTVDYQVGEIVRYTAPASKWDGPNGPYTYTGPIIGKRTMKATGKTFYQVGISRGITADMLERVAAE